MKGFDRKIAVIALSLYALLFSAVGFFARFELFGVPVMRPNFADLRLITGASECLQASSWTTESTSCDLWGRPFNYPSIWVDVFAFLKISNDHARLIGTFEIVLLAVTFLHWILRVNLLGGPKERLLFLLIVFCFLISPPILLLMERGNIDILIFFGLTIASTLLAQKSYLFAGVLVNILGILKLYPFVGLLIVITKEEKRSKLLLITLVSFLAIGSVLKEVYLISQRSFTDWNSLSYGALLLPKFILSAIGLDQTSLYAVLFGIIIFYITLVFCKVHLLRQLSITFDYIQKRNELESLFSLFALVFLATYFIGTSFDYRLVILFPIFLTLYCAFDLIYERLILCLIILLMMYGSFSASHFGMVGLFLNIIADLFLSIFCSFLLIVLTRIYLKNRSQIS